METQARVIGPLHTALAQVLPGFVKDPFSESPRLNVPKLHKSLIKPDGKCVSHETVYNWLRTNRMNPRHVQLVVELANGEENMIALKKFGRKPPAVEDFSRFVFA